MSIIDEISTFEDQLQLVRKEGERKISLLREEIDLKKIQMKNHFDQEFVERSRMLEQEMLQRVEIYKTELEYSQVDIKNLLEKQYLVKHHDILQQICLQFWGE
ncbi:MAG: hypothetical protein ACRCWI_02415 [Brevinema sp.]